MAAIPPVIATYIEGLKTHDVDRIAQTVSDELEFVTPTKTLTKNQFLQMLRALYGGFPDWHYDHDPSELCGDTVVVQWRQSGTHTGTFVLPGIDPVLATGKRVQIPQQRFFYTVRGDKIVQIRPDAILGGAPGGILEQIGVRSNPI
jgi:predicted ester cyclase